MIRFFLILSFTWCIWYNAAAQKKVEIVKFSAVQNLIKMPSDSIIVINFWATWCGPCVKEMPFFQSASSKDAFKLIFVSLDYAENVKKVESFVKKRAISQPVILLDEIDYNNWIDLVDASWSGAIPATLFINHKTGKRIFVEKELSESDILKLIEQTRS
jgi:thiol-disulfide isomerase/thioredoxin